MNNLYEKVESLRDHMDDSANTENANIDQLRYTGRRDLRALLVSDYVGVPVLTLITDDVLGDEDNESVTLVPVSNISRVEWYPMREVLVVTFSDGEGYSFSGLLAYAYAFLFGAVDWFGIQS